MDVCGAVSEQGYGRKVVSFAVGSPRSVDPQVDMHYTHDIYAHIVTYVDHPDGARV